MKNSSRTDKTSIVKEVLRGLIPNTEQNVKLAFKPSLFFNDLEQLTQSKRQTIANTLSRAKRQGLVETKDGIPVLTAKGRAKLGELNQPQLLQGWLLVSFDIPEQRRHDRYELRSYLKRRKFRLIQKSLWASQYDYVDELKDVIAELKIGQYVLVFVAATIQ